MASTWACTSGAPGTVDARTIIRWVLAFDQRPLAATTRSVPVRAAGGTATSTVVAVLAAGATRTSSRGPRPPMKTTSVAPAIPVPVRRTVLPARPCCSPPQAELQATPEMIG
ncbi:hypothetical protein FSW04_21760 [Baekduia soli]|uniref:Uncharacterized protein n=1 Tax=Baekduia soli TaxID=496014 RepID=A0A5B8UA45_9ACTN|nr:hypothetical protein [Baekduia soli]QEC49930.1 hypothetical protein FSW04_21760 [Baekduia soli]